MQAAAQAGDQSRASEQIHYWKKRLGLDDYAVITERISLFQVSDDYCRVGNNFVGVCSDREQKVTLIYHTRNLTQEDIVHELLHVRHPSWSEARVNLETAVLLKTCRSAKIC